MLSCPLRSQPCIPRSVVYSIAHRPASLSRVSGGSTETLRLPYPRHERRLHSSGTTANPTATTATPLSPTSSVSQDEVSHFTKLASSWWDPHGPSRLLHLMNPLRHDFIQTCLRSNPDTSDSADNKNKRYTYLDIGCGGGIFASSASRLPSTESVTAIDPTPSVIQIAKAHQRSDPALSEPKLTYLNCAIEDLASHVEHQQPSSKDQITAAARPKQYDIVSMFEVIEHIPDPSAFLSTALKNLKPGGWLIGSTISRHPMSYLTTILAAEAPLVGVVPAGTHNWNQYINPGEIRGWFDRENHASAQLDTTPGLEGGQEAELGSRPRPWGDVKIQGVVYVPLLGWKWVNRSENYGNYFFGVQKLRD